MGGVFGVVSNNDCVTDLFLERIIIPILGPREQECVSIVRIVLLELSTTLKILRFERNSKKKWQRCQETWG